MRAPVRYSEGVEIEDLRLLRDLRRALDAVAGQGHEAQVAALREVLARHGVTLDDVARAIRRVKERHTAELTGLARRIARLAEQRAEEVETAEAVDAFVRRLSRRG